MFGFGNKRGVALQAPATTGANAENAAAWLDAGPTEPVGASVVAYRHGPGDEAGAGRVESWLFDMRPAPHDGIETGKELFAMLADVPPEGHGGFDIPTSGPGAVIDMSTTQRFNKWTDWQASTPRHAMQGAHVTVFRLAPGSWQGYQGANQMIQSNLSRDAPAPWDSHLIVGAG